MSSQIKTGLLLGLLTALILFMGQAAGGPGGLAVAFVMALVMNGVSYWFSDKIVLRMYRGREVSPADAPALHRMVEELAQSAGLPKPRVYVLPSQTPNAFATGRNPSHAAVAVTEGILRLLSPEELRGVLAHELAHVGNRDILTQSVAAVLAGVIMLVANMLKWTAIFGGGRSDEEGGGNPVAAIALAIVAPLAAMLVQMAISRTREYEADKAGAQISGSPQSLASALGKLSAASQHVPMQEGSPATAHMFIVNPLAGGLAGLFSTHPPVEERIRRLQAMASMGGGR
ncbi:MAG: zinc metalloprotease HtpX [Thermodesulfobacteriota bacterium]